MRPKIAATVLGFALAILTSGTGSAATINWAVWSNTFTAGSTGGKATATIGSDAVTYSGEVISVFGPTLPSWGPAGTFSGGTVGNPPPPGGGGQVRGGAGTRTRTHHVSGTA